MKTPEERKAILGKMRVSWLSYGDGKKKYKRDERTDTERAWDRAILAAAEYVRRLMDYDESIALPVHDLLTPKKEAAS